MAESPHINGIYYDGILFDRFTMVRVRKALERNSKVCVLSCVIMCCRMCVVSVLSCVALLMYVLRLSCNGACPFPCEFGEYTVLVVTRDSRNDYSNEAPLPPFPPAS